MGVSFGSRRMILDIKLIFLNLNSFSVGKYQNSKTGSLLQREILSRHISKNRKLKFCIRHAFMAIMTHAKFYFNPLSITLIFGIRAFPLSPLPGERLKRSGLIGLNIAANQDLESMVTFVHMQQDLTDERISSTKMKNYGF